MNAPTSERLRDGEPFGSKARRGMTTASSRVMIVEDDPDTLAAIDATLKQAGYATVAVNTGKAALATLDSTLTIDLLLVDMGLPDMTGLELLVSKAERERGRRRRRTPALLVSGSEQIAVDSAAAAAMGLVGRLHKPFDPRELLQAVRQTVKGAGTADRPAPTAHTVQSDNLRAQVDRVLSRLLPGLADWYVLEQARAPDDPVLAIAHRHADPSRGRVLEELIAETRTAGVVGTLRGAIVAGTSCVHTDLSPAARAVLASGPEHDALLASLETRAIAIVPVACGGPAFGALVVGTSGPTGTFAAGHLQLLEALAAAVGLALDASRSLERAETSLRRREDLLAIVAHDLRAPLTTISLTAANLLSAGEADPFGTSVRMDMERILGSAQHMRRLVRDLLDIAQLATGSLRLERKPRRIGELIRTASESVGIRAGGRRVAATLNARASEAMADVDRDRILQALDNLLSNAIRHTEPGGNIALGLTQAGSELLLTVADNGTGIAPEDLPHIFDPYRRGQDAGLRGDEAGLGLGLSIVKGIIESHGGSIRVASAPGKGTTFTMTLPAAFAQPGAPLHATILVVDDDDDLREEIAATFRDAGYPTVEAGNGRSASDYLEEHERPAVVLLDLMMPVMDGWELLTAIRASPRLGATPVLVVSGLAEKRVDPSLIEIQGYLQKPTRAQDLLDAVLPFAGPPPGDHDRTRTHLASG